MQELHAALQIRTSFASTLATACGSKTYLDRTFRVATDSCEAKLSTSEECRVEWVSHPRLDLPAGYSKHNKYFGLLYTGVLRDLTSIETLGLSRVIHRTIQSRGRN